MIKKKDELMQRVSITTVGFLITWTDPTWISNSLPVESNLPEDFYIEYHSNFNTIYDNVTNKTISQIGSLRLNEAYDVRASHHNIFCLVYDHDPSNTIIAKKENQCYVQIGISWKFDEYYIHKLNKNTDKILSIIKNGMQEELTIFLNDFLRKVNKNNTILFEIEIEVKTEP